MLEKSLQWILILCLCSFYVIVNAGFAILSYWISNYVDMWIGVWVGAILCAIFTIVLSFMALRTVQQMGRS